MRRDLPLEGGERTYAGPRKLGALGSKDCMKGTGPWKTHPPGMDRRVRVRVRASGRDRLVSEG